MAHALLLGAEVAQVVLVGRDLDGYLHYFVCSQIMLGIFDYLEKQ